ncbi:acyltransferase [Chitinibacter sp. SCUT-21]|uniref:acyltransferase family protein n=1 Tax=Chitinibacter sp. SCUT-21 TaxID=2970891 RepID=UPI0035A5FBE7
MVSFKINDAESNGGRLSWLDFYRGVAIFLVVLVHIGQSFNADVFHYLTAWGQYGVQLFFCISVYTITLTHPAVRGVLDSRSHFSWMCRRIFRILPLYILAAIIFPCLRYLLYVLNLSSTSPPTLFDIGLNFFLLNSFSASAINSVVPGGWSISIEFLVYMLAPVIIFCQRRHIWSSMLVLGFVLSYALFAYTLGVGLRPENNSFFFYWPPLQILVFVIIFYLQNYIVRFFVSDYIKIILFAIFFASTLMFGVVGELNHALAAIFSGVAFAFLIDTKSYVLQWVNSRFFDVFVVVGRLSYAIYIFHFLYVLTTRKLINPDSSLMFFPLLVGCFIFTVPLAILSKVYIETPMIKLGKKISALMCP